MDKGGGHAGQKADPTVTWSKPTGLGIKIMSRSRFFNIALKIREKSSNKTYIGKHMKMQIINTTIPL